MCRWNNIRNYCKQDEGYVCSHELINKITLSTVKLVRDIKGVTLTKDSEIME